MFEESVLVRRKTASGELEAGDAVDVLEVVVGVVGVAEHPLVDSVAVHGVDHILVVRSGLAHGLDADAVTFVGVVAVASGGFCFHSAGTEEGGCSQESRSTATLQSSSSLRDLK